MKKKVYIHYGHDKFVPEYVTAYDEARKLITVGIEGWLPGNKLHTSLWASPEDSDYGWKDCDAFSFSDESLSFKFVLKDTAKVLEIRSEDDIMEYVDINKDAFRFQLRPEMKTSMIDHIRFDKIVEAGYDAIELFLSENYSLYHSIFYGWDCDSIMVMNPDIVEVIE